MNTVTISFARACFYGDADISYKSMIGGYDFKNVIITGFTSDKKDGSGFVTFTTETGYMFFDSIVDNVGALYEAWLNRTPINISII